MPQTRLVAAIVVLLAVVGAGCSGDDDRSGLGPTQSPAVSDAGPTLSDSPCAESLANEEDTASLPGLRGDVDGDGSADAVSIVIPDEAPSGCEAILVVSSGGTVLTAPIEQEGMDPLLTPPTLSGLADIDGRDGADVIVRLISGASTEFRGAYSAGEGRLERLAVRGGEFGDLFPSGGSVGHLEQSDCRAPGSIVITTAVPRADRYLVRRAVFDFDGDRFVPNEAESGKELVDPDDLASGAVPEFTSGAPFGSCPTD